MEDRAVCEARRIKKDFLRKGHGTNVMHAVSETDLVLHAGEFVVLKGASGSGKTTLLNMMAGLLTPTAGEAVFWNHGTETALWQADDGYRSALRNRFFGYIPQGAGAVGSLTVMENTLLPYVFGGKEEPDRRHIDTLFRRFGMENLYDEYPATLSGGELKRMAIVRALAKKPAVLFADEPTADLDEENTRIVFDVLRETADAGAAVLMITHEQTEGIRPDRILFMQKGTVLPGA